MDLHVVEIPGGWAVRIIGETMRRTLTRDTAVSEAEGILSSFPGRIMVSEHDGVLTTIEAAPAA